MDIVDHRTLLPQIDDDVENVEATRTSGAPIARLEPTGSGRVQDIHY
jgi:hypothetical protein